MKNKLIAVTIIFLLVSVMTPGVIAQESSSSDQDITESFLKLKSSVSVTWNETELSEPIIPETSAKNFELNITYITEHSYEISTVFTELMKNRQIDVKLEIIESPEWCQATIDKNTISTTVSTVQKNLSANLSVSVNENAVAYQSGTIKLNVSVDPQMGPLGALLLVAGYNKVYELTITPGFLPEINTEINYVNYSETDMVELPPYNETMIPIKISNLGNARTKVLAEIVYMPENWTVSLDSYVIIDMNSSGQIVVSAESDHHFEDETITVQLTPVRSDDETDSGESTNVTINLHNDGSYEEPSEDIFEIDTTMLAIILFVILLVIIVVAVFIKRK